MKVLHVLDHSIPLHSGYTFRSKNIILQQRKLGIETIHVTSPKQGPCSESIETIDELVFYRCEVPSSFSLLSSVIDPLIVIHTLKKRLKEVIEIEKPDIIHAHSPALNGSAASWAAKHFNIPLVYEIRAFWEDAAVDHGTCKEDGIRYRLTRQLETNVVKKANAVTVICDGLKQDLIKRGIEAEKITQIPNAVDLDKFADREIDSRKISELKAKHNLSESYVLGFLGSFYAYEGIDDLLRALAQLDDKKFKLLLVGGGPEEARLKALCSELGLDKRVVFTGRVPHSDIASYYDMVDLLVFPRKAMRLTDKVTPLKPLEAMAQRKLVLASDVGGHRELISDSETGFLFRANNIESLVNKVQQISAKDHFDILNNGLDFVTNKRNWQHSVKNYLPVYEQLVLRNK
jgi:PEP-CTERM/exosortase A-associated glycosyltransferase